MEKSFDEIMKEINAGLTGDYQADLKYLEGKCREYKDHQMGKEVVRECGRIMFEILPEDKKAELSKALEQDKTAERAVLDGIRTLMTGETYNPTMADLEAYSKEYGFPVGADRDVVGLAVSYGKHFLEEKEFGGAKYCLGIAYALTDDEGIKELLDTIPEVQA